MQYNKDDESDRLEGFKIWALFMLSIVSINALTSFLVRDTHTIQSNMLYLAIVLLVIYLATVTSSVDDYDRSNVRRDIIVIGIVSTIGMFLSAISVVDHNPITAVLTLAGYPLAVYLLVKSIFTNLALKKSEKPRVIVVDKKNYKKLPMHKLLKWYYSLVIGIVLISAANALSNIGGDIITAIVSSGLSVAGLYFFVLGVVTAVMAAVAHFKKEQRT
ncbi:MAG: hypothetical protein EON54_01345 [Alcaligenaceae bacterium]|nr:MAG: hypothetical protein EON54_01345 [Alcaligenaceae bacterium]